MCWEKRMNKIIKLSVIIPAYNVEKWIGRCLDSVLNQTFQDIEIIVIDDGSIDKTGEILDEYSLRYDQINVIHQKNQGLINVRETGIKLAKGEFIGFIDGDDCVNSVMYQKLIKNAEKYEADISQCGMLYCFYDGRKKPMYGTEDIHIYDNFEGQKELLEGRKIEPSLCNKIYKKEILINSCLDKSILNNEDLLRNFVLFKRAKRSVLEDFCGYEYWRREDSMSNNSRQIFIWNNIIKARKLILNNAAEDIKIYARKSYLTAVIGGYNSVMTLKETEARHFQKKCRAVLKKNKKYLHKLEKKAYAMSVFILYLPNIYKLLRKK